MGCCSRSLDRRWKGGLVTFTVHSGMTNVTELHDAIREIERTTNLRFVRRVGQGSSAGDFIEFRNGQFFCQSQAENGDAAIGRQGGRQIVFCLPGSGTGTFIHEIGHAVGLFHEHERSDRNNFVTINTGNIQPNRGGNFRRRTNTLNSDPYDFRSVMHYAATTFSANGNPTIQPVTPGTRLNGSNTFTATDRAFLDAMYPTRPIVRRSDSSIDPDHAGDAREIAATRISGTSDLVTAIVDDTDDHNLLLIRWRVDDRGGITRIADTHGAPAGRASSVSVADVGGRIVTAFRSSTKNLMLIAYDASGTGLTRFPGNSGQQAGSAMQIKVIALSGNRCLTVCRTDDQHRRLLLIVWQVNADGSVTRRGDSGTLAGEASDIAVTLVRRIASERGVLVATASRTSADTGRVRVIVWFVGDDNSIERRGDTGDTGEHALGDASQLALISRHQGRTLILSCRDSHNRLLLISLSVSDNGRLVQRVDATHGAAGEIVRNALVARPYGCLSAVSDQDENLFLIKWELDDDRRLRRLGDSGDKQAGRAGIVTAVAVSQGGNAPIVTPVRSGRPSLFLVSWDDRPANGELTL
ncbi:MAG: hypothetical protein KJ061_09965 [Vicinamibacteraceae bacterium]|nr:hypothetical protein [Vicinamibacteraceae bacterium]